MKKDPKSAGRLLSVYFEEYHQFPRHKTTRPPDFDILAVIYLSIYSMASWFVVREFSFGSDTCEHFGFCGQLQRMVIGSCTPTFGECTPNFR